MNKLDASQQTKNELLSSLDLLKQVTDKLYEHAYYKITRTINYLLRSPEDLNLREIYVYLEHLLKTIKDSEDLIKEYTININGEQVTASLSQLLDFTLQSFIDRVKRIRQRNA